MGIGGQPVETLPLHRATPAARDTAQLDLHEDPYTSAGKVADPAHRAIVDAPVNPAAHSTGRFFERRTSLTMRRWGSPKTPTIVCRGRKPGNRYESERRRRGLGNRIPQSCQVSASAQPGSDPLPERVPGPLTPPFDPHESPKTLLSLQPRASPHVAITAAASGPTRPD